MRRRKALKCFESLSKASQSLLKASPRRSGSWRCGGRNTSTAPTWRPRTSQTAQSLPKVSKSFPRFTNLAPRCAYLAPGGAEDLASGAHPRLVARARSRRWGGRLRPKVVQDRRQIRGGRASPPGPSSAGGGSCHPGFDACANEDHEDHEEPTDRPRDCDVRSPSLCVNFKPLTSA